MLGMFQNVCIPTPSIEQIPYMYTYDSKKCYWVLQTKFLSQVFMLLYELLLCSTVTDFFLRYKDGSLSYNHSLINPFILKIGMMLACIMLIHVNDWANSLYIHINDYHVDNHLYVTHISTHSDVAFVCYGCEMVPFGYVWWFLDSRYSNLVS